jgi:hypothetical protein
MLQRIYGTAWADKKQLKAYLKRLEEAEKRDHRKLGKQLDLFHTQEEAPGMVFWHDRGWRIYTGDPGLHPRALREARLPGSATRRRSVDDRSCGRNPGTGTSSATTCS